MRAKTTSPAVSSAASHVSSRVVLNLWRPCCPGLKYSHLKGEVHEKYEIFDAPAHPALKIVNLKGEAHEINMKDVESLAPQLPRPAEQSLQRERLAK
jgi:hypothetical protein